MSDRVVWQIAEAVSVIAAVSLFLLRPELSEDQPLPTASPAALPLDSGRQWVMDTKLEAPDWPIQIAAASLVVMPTKTSNCSEMTVEASPTSGKSAAKAVVKAKRRVSMPASILSTKPRLSLQIAQRGSKEAKH
jgi:hypothetical protein